MTQNKLSQRCTAGCVERTVYARHKQLEYGIMIAIPKQAPPAGGYPVIYALDGDAVFDTWAEAARLQTRKPHGYDPALVVGIGYPSREPFDMDRRCYDFTMPAEARNLPIRPNGQKWPENGGADAFLDFVEKELRPIIERDYTVDPGRQTIFGHSLGGLLVLHALFSRPQAFQNYVAGSPSIWWNNRALLQEKASLEASGLPKDCKPRLLLTIGADELAEMVSDAEKLAAELQRPAFQGLHVQLSKFPEEGHVSVLPAAISRALRFALSTESSMAK